MGVWPCIGVPHKVLDCRGLFPLRWLMSILCHTDYGAGSHNITKRLLVVWSCILYIVSNMISIQFLYQGIQIFRALGCWYLVGIERARTTRVTDVLKMCYHTSRTQCNYWPHVGSPHLFISTGRTWPDDIWCVHVVTVGYILEHILY